MAAEVDSQGSQYSKICRIQTHAVQFPNDTTNITEGINSQVQQRTCLDVLVSSASSSPPPPLLLGHMVVGLTLCWIIRAGQNGEYTEVCLHTRESCLCKITSQEDGKTEVKSTLEQQTLCLPHLPGLVAIQLQRALQ